MAIYRFSFDDKYAGHTAVVTDKAGAAVAGSPVTLDIVGDGSLDLAPGYYRARVDNSGSFGDGYSYVDGVYDIEASIAAAAVPDGGLDLSSSPNMFACTTGVTVDSGAFSTDIPFDTVPAGFTPGTEFDLPAGLYLINVELDCTEPAQDRYLSFYLQGSANNTDTHGPFVITPGTVTSAGYSVYSTVIFNKVAGQTLRIALIADVASDAVSPADLHIGYAGFNFAKIG